MAEAIASQSHQRLMRFVYVRLPYIAFPGASKVEHDCVLPVDLAFQLLFSVTDAVTVVVHQEVEVGKTFSPAHLMDELVVWQVNKGWV